MTFRTIALSGWIWLAGAGALAAAELEPRLSFAPPAGERAVALTLDACGGGFDRRIFDALLETGAKATFFVTDRWMRKNPQALAELTSRPSQFQIENHGLNHVPAVTGTGSVFGIRTAGTIEGVRREVEGGAQAVAAAAGTRPKWFRGATARYSPDAIEAINALGHKVAGFSLNADMGASLIPSLVARRIEGARSGDVVIVHVNKPENASGAGVARGILALAAEGVRFVRLDEVDPKTELGPVLHGERDLAHKRHVQRNEHVPDSRDAAKREEVPRLRPAVHQPPTTGDPGVQGAR